MKLTKTVLKQMIKEQLLIEAETFGQPRPTEETPEPETGISRRAGRVTGGAAMELKDQINVRELADLKKQADAFKEPGTGKVVDAQGRMNFLAAILKGIGYGSEELVTYARTFAGETS